MHLHRPERSSRHHRTGRLAAAGTLGLVVVLTVAACSGAHPPSPEPSPTGSGRPAPAGTYAPAIDRSAEFLGETTFTTAELHDIATHDSQFTIAKFAQGFDIDKQFQTAAALMAAARAAGNPGLKVNLYYDASFWLLANVQGWKPYSTSFDPAWYLTSSTGAPVVFHGEGKTAAKKATVGYVLDLADPAYRQWAVRTVVAWMHQAPVRGVTLDSADLLVGDTVRPDIGAGTQTWNDLLCGAGAAVDAQGDCPAVAAWNQGLHDLLAQLSAALRPLGDTVTFNGLAPSALRTADRNQELFADAPVADNEGFCLEHGRTDSDAGVDLTSVPADVAMMQAQARAGHQIVEITNYDQTPMATLGPYCAGAFLLGWQPGSDFYVYHHSYADPLTDSDPEVAELDLTLGLPTGQAVDHDGVMTRTFQHGTVVVDTTTATATASLPGAATQFAAGRELGDHPAGSSVDLAPHSAQFFLDDTYLAQLAAVSR